MRVRWGWCVLMVWLGQAAAQDAGFLLDRGEDSSFRIRAVEGWTATGATERDVLVHGKPFCSLNVSVDPAPPMATSSDDLRKMLVAAVERGLVRQESLVWHEAAPRFEGIVGAQVEYSGVPARGLPVPMRFVQCIVLTARHTLVLTVSTHEELWQQAEAPVAALLAAIELVDPQVPGVQPAAPEIPSVPERPQREVGAIEALSLPWLARHQEADGHWSVEGWRLRCPEPGCPAAAAGDAQDVGLTGLALLAFLGEGNSHKFGPFKRPIRRALSWLVKRQQPDGALAEELGEHSLGLRALAETCYLTDDFKLEEPGERALAWLLARLDEQGWADFTAEEACDLVLSLRTARLNAWEVGTALAAAADHLRVLEPATLSARSACLLGRILCGEARNDEGLRALAHDIAEELRDAPPERARVAYLAVYALFQAGDADWAVAQDFVARLRAEREQTGCAAGSFPRLRVSGQFEEVLWLLLAEEVDFRYQRINRE